MKSLIITGPGQIEIAERPKPVPGPGDVLLRILYVGFCGSDLSTYRGKNPLVSYPRIPGHEVSAIIEETGPAVPGTYKKGQRVTVIPYSRCGRCASCLKKRYNACKNNRTLGVQRDGAMTGFITMPYESVLANDDLSEMDLALVEPLTVGFHAVARGHVMQDDKVFVIGCGMIGIGAIMAAMEKGARVIAGDSEESKLDFARSLKVHATVNTRSPDDRTHALFDFTRGHGPDVVIEAAGQKSTYQMALDHVAFAGRVVCIGYARDDIPLATRLWVQKELDILGSRNADPADFMSVIRYMKDCWFPSGQVVSQIISPEEAPAAMKAWAREPGRIRKILVRF